MNKSIYIIVGFFSVLLTSRGQNTKNSILFIIDSVPVLTDPESWNQLPPEDIADFSIITNKDSLKMLGWEQMDGLAFIFTKAYRSRPDSIRKIPSLKQMVMKDGRWTLGVTPYSGRYIDYYNNGRIQNEGSLLNGKIDGELTVYYKTGIKKSVTTYKEGVRHGPWKEFYQNGALMRSDDYLSGKSMRTGSAFFLNGQIKQAIKRRKETSFDTAVEYYSTGKVKKMTLTKTGEFHPEKKEADMNYYTTMFYEQLRTGDIKAANKSFYHIWSIDSTSTDTYFKDGLLLANEFRLDQAIAKFDKALEIEPLMREALEQRAAARLNRYKFFKTMIPLSNRKNIPLVLEDFNRLPEEEKVKVCNDVLLANDLDPGVNYQSKGVFEWILNYCKTNSNR